MKRYATLDIQSRLATWIVPLFLLIASIPFAPLGVGNMTSVVINLLADPISSFESQISKFAYVQRRLKYCHSCLGQMPDNLKKAIAMIDATHEESGPEADQKARDEESGPEADQKVRDEESGPGADHISTQKTFTGEKGQRRSQGRQMSSGGFIMDRPTLLYIFAKLLGENSFPLNRKQQLHRITCLEVANQLSDLRNPSLTKAIFGIIVYLMSVSVAFIYIATDNFKPHTDHSIATAVLYSWLVPAGLLGALIGGFGKKQSAGDILAQLYRKSSIIEAGGCNEGSGQEATSPVYLTQQHQAVLLPLRICSSQSRVEPDTVRWLRLLELENEHTDYSYLCWSGGNSTFRPCQSSRGKRNSWITAIAHLPVTCSVLCPLRRAWAAVRCFNPYAERHGSSMRSSPK